MLRPLFAILLLARVASLAEMACTSTPVMADESKKGAGTTGPGFLRRCWNALLMRYCLRMSNANTSSFWDWVAAPKFEISQPSSMAFRRVCSVCSMHLRLARPLYERPLGMWLPGIRLRAW